MKKILARFAVVFAFLFAGKAFSSPEYVDERHSDVIVVGGTMAAVSAALTAKDAGADVLLLAPRPYLGEDVAGTMELAKSGELPADHRVTRAIWEGDETALDFSYRLTSAPSPKHPDDGKKLNDGLSDNPETQSVQFDAEKVRIELSLPKVEEVTTLEVVSFESPLNAGVAEMHFIYFDENGKVSPVLSLPRVMNYCGVPRMVYRAELNKKVRSIAIGMTRGRGKERILLGEITLRGRNTGRRTREPTLVEVKTALDGLMLKGGVRYLTGTMVKGVTTDENGMVRGVEFVSREGVHRARAGTVIDATRYGTVVLSGGGAMAPYPAGQRVCRNILSLDEPSADGLEVERLARRCPAYIQHDVQKFGRDHIANFYRCTFVSPRAIALTPQGIGEIEMKARDLTVTRGEIDAGDEVVLPVPKVSRAVRGVHFFGARKDLNAVDAEIKKLVARKPVCGKTALKKVAIPSVKYDVVVVGGGTAGAPAAIGAAREGARTLTVDYMHKLGGVGTAGMIGYYWYGKKCGFTAEVEKGIAAMKYAVKTQAKAEWWRRENRAAGGDIWFGCMGYGTVLNGRTVAGAMVATPFGPYRVMSSQTVDATGSADLVAAAGGKTEWIGAGQIVAQGAGLPTKRPGWVYSNSDWGLVNDNDLVGTWLFALQGRKCAKGEWDIAQLTDTRERRRMVGRMTVQPLDVLNGRKFYDTIAQGQTDFDTHGPTIADCCLVAEFDDRHLFELNIPFRALLPEALDNIAVVGIGASAHRDAMPFMRMQADVQNEGYAAGVAAARCAKDKCTLAKVDMRALQKHLSAIGSVPVEVLGWQDTSPYSDDEIRAAAKQVGNGYRGVGIVLSDPKRAIPYLKEGYAEAKDEKSRLCLAHVLGILGDPTGADALIAQLSKPGNERIIINTEKKRSFGRRMGEFDSQIVALGRTGDPRAAGVLAKAIEALPVRGGFSTARAIELACERGAFPMLAPVLAAALEKRGMSGYSRPVEKLIMPRGGFGTGGMEEYCLRELHLARALWNCGDCRAIARRILEAYAKDPRGIYARHARAVLATEKASKGE